MGNRVCCVRIHSLRSSLGSIRERGARKDRPAPVFRPAPGLRIGRFSLKDQFPVRVDQADFAEIQLFYACLDL